MGEFDEYVTGIMELKVGGKPLKLDFGIKDKRKLKSAIGNEKPTEAELEKIDNVILDTMYRCYPNENKEGLKGFYMRFENEIMEQLMVKAGWTTEEKIKEAQKNVTRPKQN